MNKFVDTMLIDTAEHDLRKELGREPKLEEIEYRLEENGAGPEEDDNEGLEIEDDILKDL